MTPVIKIKYHDKNIPKVEYVGGMGVSNWIDLYAAEDVPLLKGESALVSLGISVKLPDGYEAHLAPRSSTFKRIGVLQTNSVGVIDNSYSGENDVWKMPVYAIRDTVILKGRPYCPVPHHADHGRGHGRRGRSSGR